MGVVTARSAERGEGQAEQRPVMSGAGRGPTFPGAGHQVTSFQATQLVADRKDFRGQREPTEAIIGNGHGTATRCGPSNIEVTRARST